MTFPAIYITLTDWPFINLSDPDSNNTNMSDDKNNTETEESNVEAEPQILKRDESEIAYSPIFNPAAELEDVNPTESADNWNESDFDDKFDDDFEEEVEGEYELEDDEYGEEFAEVEEMMGMRESDDEDEIDELDGEAEAKD